MGGGRQREKLGEKREAGSGRMADACQVLIVLIDMPIFTLVTAACVCVWGGASANESQGPDQCHR